MKDFNMWAAVQAIAQSAVNKIPPFAMTIIGLLLVGISAAVIVPELWAKVRPRWMRVPSRRSIHLGCPGLKDIAAFSIAEYEWVKIRDHGDSMYVKEVMRVADTFLEGITSKMTERYNHLLSGRSQDIRTLAKEESSYSGTVFRAVKTLQEIYRTTIKSNGYYKMSDTERGPYPTTTAEMLLKKFKEKIELHYFSDLVSSSELRNLNSVLYEEMKNGLAGCLKFAIERSEYLADLYDTKLMQYCERYHIIFNDVPLEITQLKKKSVPKTWH